MDFWFYAFMSLILTIAGISAWIFLFGLPPSFKQWLQQEAIERMADTQAKDLAKSVLDQVPEREQDELKGLRGPAKDMLGKNGPLGDLGKSLGGGN